MKAVQKLLQAIVFAFVCIMVISFNNINETNPLNGAWLHKSGNEHQVLLFTDGYFTHTSYNIAARKFNYTHGGPYSLYTNRLSIFLEFDTHNKEMVGDTLKHLIAIVDDKLTMDVNNEQLEFVRIDNGKENLAGLWKITARKQGEKVVPIHQTGPRKTIKILTGTRFQWAAINPATKEFSGTGGGSYTFKDGKYTEHIEYFSRDSTRVGASLGFDGKVENKDWHHSGLSSKGDPIYEVWSRH